MSATRTGSRLSFVLAGALALAACGKQEPPPPPPAKPTPAPAPAAPAPAPAPTPTAPPASAEQSAVPAPQGNAVFSSVALGNGVDPNGNLTTPPTTTFTPKDTIYALVSTIANGPPATLTARWTFQGGQLVNETSQTVSKPGASVTTFHIAKPDGWPPGHYTLTISIDGKPAGTKEFDVK